MRFEDFHCLIINYFMVTEKTLFNILSNSPVRNRQKKDSSESFLISRIPPEWFLLRDRKIWWCAHYSLKAVIEWKSNTVKPIEDYSADWRSRTTYLMTPWWITKVLKKYKLKYTILKARTLSDIDKLLLLKSCLKDGPVILLVANWQTKRRWFSRWRAMVHRHYVTLWWYDDKFKCFYVYDSNTKRKTETTVMKWTLKVPYKYILKEWWIWASKIIYSNYAIAVKY